MGEHGDAARPRGRRAAGPAVPAASPRNGTSPHTGTWTVLWGRCTRCRARAGRPGRRCRRARGPLARAHRACVEAAVVLGQQHRVVPRGAERVGEAGRAASCRRRTTPSGRGRRPGSAVIDRAPRGVGRDGAAACPPRTAPSAAAPVVPALAPAPDAHRPRAASRARDGPPRPGRRDLGPRSTIAGGPVRGRGGGTRGRAGRRAGHERRVVEAARPPTPGTRSPTRRASAMLPHGAAVELHEPGRARRRRAGTRA